MKLQAADLNTLTAALEVTRMDEIGHSRRGELFWTCEDKSEVKDGAENRKVGGDGGGGDVPVIKAPRKLKIKKCIYFSSVSHWYCM